MFTCTATEKLKQQSGNFPGGGEFEQLFGPGRWGFEQKFSKNLPGGMLKLRFDWFIQSVLFVCKILALTLRIMRKSAAKLQENYTSGFKRVFFGKVRLRSQP